MSLQIIDDRKYFVAYWAGGFPSVRLPMVPQTSATPVNTVTSSARELGRTVGKLWSQFWGHV